MTIQRAAGNAPKAVSAFVRKAAAINKRRPVPSSTGVALRISRRQAARAAQAGRSAPATVHVMSRIKKGISACLFLLGNIRGAKARGIIIARFCREGAYAGAGGAGRPV